MWHRRVQVQSLVFRAVGRIGRQSEPVGGGGSFLVFLFGLKEFQKLAANGASSFRFYCPGNNRLSEPRAFRFAAVLAGHSLDWCGSGLAATQLTGGSDSVKLVYM
jgi:hypothetical protein